MIGLEYLDQVKYLKFESLIKNMFVEKFRISYCFFIVK